MGRHRLPQRLQQQQQRLQLLLLRDQKARFSTDQSKKGKQINGYRLTVEKG